MKKISIVLLSMALGLLIFVGCTKNNNSTKNDSNNAETEESEEITAANSSEEEPITIDEPYKWVEEESITIDEETNLSEEESITIDEAYSWYVGDIWNPITSFRDYISYGTDSCGETFDADFAYEQYQKKITLMEKYTTYIHDNHPDIASAWDKMMEQVESINQNLADGYETGSEEINTDLLSQYSQAFYDYYYDLP